MAADKDPASLAGKGALIIGASRGIGAATAVLMGQMGARLVLAARDLASLDGVAKQVTDAGGEASTMRLDMMDVESVAQVVDAAADRLGQLDVAVNNAGSAHPLTKFCDITLDMFDYDSGVNMRGVFVALQREINAMLQAGGGSIVNVGSASSLIGSGRLAVYAATKHGMLGLTKSAAVEYGAENIRVNLVAPGATRTDMLRGEEMLKRITPMSRSADPVEIAHAIAWLASDASSYVTGVALPVDGGLTISATLLR